MYYVYTIRSLIDIERIYVGYTTNLKQRLETHNRGGSLFTAKYKPWKLITYVSFSNETKAKNFEQYLKTSAGKAFAKKRFW